MRVVSLVPSWTETLLHAGVEIVGRTRFCIHPEESVKSIPTLGGTKNCDWEKIKTLRPDLVILDREENTEEMAQDCPVPWYATHVQSLKDMPAEIRKLNAHFHNLELENLSHRWEGIIESAVRPVGLPGVVQWLREGEQPVRKVAYIIWRNPWMAAGENTFIGSILKHWGFENVFTGEKYPKFDMAKIPSGTTLLFSSEPYPFAKRPPSLEEIPHPMAIVDGEKYSWFGLRSLVFLEEALAK